MSIDYRKEVDSGFDRKRIVERMTVEALKSGVPIEIVKKEKYYNFKHNEMMTNLKKGFNSKLEEIEEEYNLYGVDPLEIELSEDYFKVAHPVGGELYPMTPFEEREKFRLRDSYIEQINELNNSSLEYYEKKYNDAIDDIILFKQMHPVINQIMDCVDAIEIKEIEQNRNLSLEEITQIYTQMGLKNDELDEYNKIYNGYKMLEKILDDTTKNYNLIQEGKTNFKLPEIQKLEKLKNDIEKEILLRNTKLVNAFIRTKFKNLLVEADDLFQVCYLGLYKAIQTFDLSKETKFSTHAYVIMNSEVHRNFKELTGLKWEIYWEKKYLEKQLKIMSETLGRRATLLDLDEYGLLSIRYDKAARILNTNYILPGYRKKDYKGSNPNNYKDYEIIEDEDKDVYEYDEENEKDAIQFPFDKIGNKQLREELINVLGTLTQKEEEVLKLRFGIDGDGPLSLEEVGVIFNLSKERIRQIEAKALRKLRHPSRALKVKDFML